MTGSARRRDVEEMLGAEDLGERDLGLELEWVAVDGGLEVFGAYADGDFAAVVGGECVAAIERESVWLPICGRRGRWRCRRSGPGRGSSRASR